MLSPAENQALALHVRQDLARIHVAFPHRWSVPRGGSRARPVRTVQPIAPAPGAPSPEFPTPAPGAPAPGAPGAGEYVPGAPTPTPEVPSPALAPAPTTQYGAVVQLKAEVYNITPGTYVLAVSDWFTSYNAITHITVAADIQDPMTDGVRIFVSDTSSPPNVPGPGCGKELLLAYSARHTSPPYPKEDLTAPGSPGYSVTVNTPCLVPIPYPRWRLLMYYYIASPGTTNYYRAVGTFDVREIVSGGADVHLAFPPEMSRPEISEPIIETPSPPPPLSSQPHKPRRVYWVTRWPLYKDYTPLVMQKIGEGWRFEGAKQMWTDMKLIFSRVE